MDRPVLNIIDGVPFLCYPNGMRAQVSRTDPRYAEAIRQIERDAEADSQLSVRRYGGGKYEIIR